MYFFESRIRYSETDAHGRLNPEKLIDYFQDCSTFQSEDIGVGPAQMREKGLAWIIVYWRVESRRMPRMGETVRIGTFPYEMKGGMAFRNFLMETAAGEKLAVANSVWALVDAETMRPVRIPSELRERYPFEDRLEMEYDARKIRVPAAAGVPQRPVTVREYHLDTNRHMNNGQYVRIAAGFLPPDAGIRVLRIEYRRQAKLGDIIIPVLYGPSPEDSAAAGDIPAGSAEGRSEGEKEKQRQTAMQTTCIALNTEDGGTYAILEASLED